MINQYVKNEKMFENEVLKQVRELNERMQLTDVMTLVNSYKTYFVTTTYHDVFAHKEIDQKLHLAKRLQDGFFMHMMGKTLPKYQKPNQRFKQPVSIDFHDFPETKKGYANLHKSPHTHSIFLIHPETLGRFEAFRDRNFDLDYPSSKTEHIQSVDCQLLEINDDLSKVISYSSKFLRQPGALAYQSELHSLVYSVRGGELTNR